MHALRLMAIGLALSSATVGIADVLYDSLWIVDEQRMDAGTGNAIGGANGPTRSILDVQIADDFDLDGTYRVTRVVADIMAYNGTVPAEGVWVQFYAHNVETDGPAEPVAAEFVVSPADFTFTKLDTPLSFPAWRIDMDLTGTDIRLDAGTWWVNTQPLDIRTNGDWFWHLGSVTVPTIGLRSHVRDGWEDHGNSYGGLWNTTNWIPHNFRGNNSISMRIEGDPVGACNPCDANCDGAVNAGDIEPFIGLLFAGDAPCGAGCAGDTDGDGQVNAQDIEGFIGCLFP